MGLRRRAETHTHVGEGRRAGRRAVREPRNASLGAIAARREPARSTPDPPLVGAFFLPARRRVCQSRGACDSGELSEEVAAAIDLYAGLVYCDDSASADGLTPAEATCQDGATKTLASFVVKRLSCFRKCHEEVQKGDLPAGACTLPVSDPDSVKCIATASTKAAAAIDKVCAPPGGDRPECFGALDGTGWTSLIGGVVDGYDPQFFCGSPSGAFL